MVCLSSRKTVSSPLGLVNHYTQLPKQHNSIYARKEDFLPNITTLLAVRLEVGYNFQQYLNRAKETQSVIKDYGLSATVLINHMSWKVCVSPCSSLVLCASL